MKLSKQHCTVDWHK